MNPSAIREKVLGVGKRLAEQALRYAAETLGDVSEKEQEDAAVKLMKERVRLEVEQRDHLLPLIGYYMDLPPVDFTQRAAEDVVIRAFIRKVKAEQQLNHLRETGQT